MSWQPGNAPMMGGHRITERVAELEKQLEEMKKYIIIGMGGSTIEIKSGGTLKLTGATGIDDVLGRVVSHVAGDPDARLGRGDRVLRPAA